MFPHITTHFFENLPGGKNQKHHVSIRWLVFTCDIYVRSSMQQTNAVCFSPNGRRRRWWRKRGKETFNGPGANITTSYFAKKKCAEKNLFFLAPQPFLSALGSIKSSLWFIRMMNVRLGNRAVGGNNCTEKFTNSILQTPILISRMFSQFQVHQVHLPLRVSHEEPELPLRAAGRH